MAFNSLFALMDFFGTPDNPVSDLEFVEFWKTLSEEEKVYYETTPLV